MRIAATYDSSTGTIFQHFGRTEAFKIYEVADGKITSDRVLSSDGAGHSALAGLLAGQGIDVLICGGIGGGAQNALAAAGIEICSGASGSADAAAEAYLKGELTSAGVNCDHHHGEEHTCGEHGCGEHGEEHECGCGGHEDGQECGSCGGGCGGCGGPREIILEGKNAGKTCRVHYRGTFNDGTQFDSSYDRGEPLEFVCGTGMMIHGFDAAVVDMEPGQIVDIHLMPEEAYGMPDPNAVFTLKISELPGAENLRAGQQVYLSNAMGQPFRAVVTQCDGDSITFDANHEMAGKELNFRIELVEVG